MSDLLPVDSGLVRQTLVETLFGEVEKRSDEHIPAEVASVLLSDAEAFAGAGETVLDHDLRRFGYHARRVEVELFEPARRPAEWMPGLLREHLARTGDWAQALGAACAGLVRTEPIGKPSPTDEAAHSWRVPGPGGHVRHYLARRTIEDFLRERDQPVAGDPAELKRAWLYGFFVRAGVEALPTDASLGAPA
ncbi:MAG: hypothetical protein WKF94_12050 [Solirubrobacteraceae bacterium]